MKKWNNKLTNLLTVLVFFILVTIVLFAYGWQNIWKLRFGSADMGDVKFETFTPSKKPNHALFCPDNYCRNAIPNKIVQAYDLNIDALRNQLLALIEAEKDIHIMAADEQAFKYRFVQYTPLMRFPDTIRVKFIDLGNDKSSMAIFSESQIGHSDLGVNYKRIDRWVQQIIPK